uniref:Uncharacterized protein n=1 Tax=Eptatretus burgeri TaxID=7764 RepID=A0A8C4QA95_EPTBU
MLLSILLFFILICFLFFLQLPPPMKLDVWISRPGRPPKRSHGLLSPEGLIPHAVSGLLSPTVLSPAGVYSSLSHIGGALPLMMMSHPLLPVTLPHAASVSMAISHMTHLGNAAAAGGGELQLQPPRLDHALVKVDCNSLDKGAGLQGVALPPDFPAAFLFADSLSSTETLLANIQGLLKVAADSARVQDKQAQLEKSELRVELLRERESRESLERELAAEQRARELAQKRLKKEKKTKRKLQEALQVESKRREQAEQALSQASTEGLRVLRGKICRSDATVYQLLFWLFMKFMKHNRL